MLNTLLAALFLLWWFLIPVLFEEQCQMIFWLHPFSCGGFIFRFYRKLMSNALDFLLLLWCFLIQCLLKLMPNAMPALLLLWWFLFQFLLKTNTKCYSACPPLPAVVSCSIFIQFLLQTDTKCYYGCPPPPLVVVSNSNRLENEFEVLFWLPPLLLWWFLIKFLFKTNAKCSSGCHVPLVVVSHSSFIWSMMPNALLAVAS